MQEGVMKTGYVQKRTDYLKNNINLRESGTAGLMLSNH